MYPCTLKCTRMHPNDAPNLTKGQCRVMLVMHHVKGGWISGPSPNYQGDNLHSSNAELCDLVDRGLVKSAPLPEPRSTDDRHLRTPYLTFTHRFRLTALGRTFIANYFRTI